MSDRSSLAGLGAARVLRQQRILWWIFAVGFLLAWLGSRPLRTAAGSLLDHSLATSRIAGTVDLAVLVEALSHPTLRLGPLAGASVALDLVYFVFLLFVAGGTLVAYRDDRRLSRAEFHGACGCYFWRLVRLSLLSLVPLALVAGVLIAGGALSRRVAEASPLESRAVAVNLAAVALALALFLCVRLWFDVAQARLVVEDERAMWRTALGALRTSAGSFGPLFWLYLRVGVLVLAVHALTAWLWLRVPGSAFALSFLLLQAVLLVQFAARLWLRASVVAWYSARAQALAGRRAEPPVAEPAPLADVASAAEPQAEAQAQEKLPEQVGSEASSRS